MVKVGDNIKFNSEKGQYKVKACNERYAICTKPYNPQRTVFYTIIDFKQSIRSTNNLVFNMYDYKIQEDIDACLVDLIAGKIELSRRNQIDLDIDSVNNEKFEYAEGH